MKRGSSLLDTVSPVETPEGVHLNLRCAGMPARMLGGLMDLLIVLVIFMIGMAVIETMGMLVGEAAMVIASLFGFGVSWFYPMICELTMDGQTFGKRWAGLRVVQTSGAPVSWQQSATRSVLWSLDLMFCISIPVMLLSRDFRRIGDLAADTVVIYTDEPNRKKKVDVRVWPKGTPQRAAVFTPDETRAVVAFAERSSKISRERQRELAGIVAAGLDCTQDEAVQRLYDHALYAQGVES